MEYQLAMTEAGMLIEALIEEQGLRQEDYVASEEEVAAFFQDQLATMPGAPTSFENVPVDIRTRIAEQASLAKFKKAVERRMHESVTALTVQIYQTVVDNVPLPEQKQVRP